MKVLSGEGIKDFALLGIFQIVRGQNICSGDTIAMVLLAPWLFLYMQHSRIIQYYAEINLYVKILMCALEVCITYS